MQLKEQTTPVSSLPSLQCQIISSHVHLVIQYLLYVAIYVYAKCIKITNRQLALHECNNLQTLHVVFSVLALVCHAYPVIINTPYLCIYGFLQSLHPQKS